MFSLKLPKYVNVLPKTNKKTKITINFFNKTKIKKKKKLFKKQIKKLMKKWKKKGKKGKNNEKIYIYIKRKNNWKLYTYIYKTNEKKIVFILFVFSFFY
jgi:hypothetical protein